MLNYVNSPIGLMNPTESCENPIISLMNRKRNISEQTETSNDYVLY